MRGKSAVDCQCNPLRSVDGQSPCHNACAYTCCPSLRSLPSLASLLVFPILPHGPSVGQSVEIVDSVSAPSALVPRMTLGCLRPAPPRLASLCADLIWICEEQR